MTQLASCASNAPHDLFVPPAIERSPGSPAFETLDEWSWITSSLHVARHPMARPALSQGALGLFAAAQFEQVAGACRRCTVPPALLWYFKDQIVAVPKSGSPVTGVAGDRSKMLGPGPSHARPAVVWIAAPDVIDRAVLSSDASVLRSDGRTVPLVLGPRLETNPIYVDDSTARFFAGRALSLRGAVREEGGREQFVARTLWPLDGWVNPGRARLEPLTPAETLGTLIEAQSNAGERDLFPERVLWEREPGAARGIGGKPVLAFVLSGAQGEDDGARAGHLSVATGRFGEAGEWGHWLVDNFYPLRRRGAKGIIPSTLPMDNYLLDLNSGQLYYRPAYMLVAVMRTVSAPSAAHRALHQALLRLYCGETEFHLSRNNSTGMTVDALRGLGWRLPRIGPTSRFLAVLGAPIAAIVTGRFGAARDFFAAMAGEQTRLLPRVAFEVVGHDLLRLATGAAARAPLTPFEQMLAEDMVALLFLRLPQVPSARATGTYPVRSLLSYGAYLQADPTGYDGAPQTPLLEPPEALLAMCRERLDPP